LACNDFRARHAIEACAIAGVKVPEEVAVLGVDNDEIVCGLATPQISSIELNTQKSGYEAAQLLEKLIDKKQVISEDTIIVQPIEIVTRQSSNILAVSDVEMVEIMRYIRSNSDRAIAVGEVVEKMAMSRRTIEQRFKKAFGRTIHQEIRRARVEHVERMLLNTNRPIAEISFDLGYPSPKHLTRYFKQEKSLTPREYRRKYSK